MRGVHLEPQERQRALTQSETLVVSDQRQDLGSKRRISMRVSTFERVITRRFNSYTDFATSFSHQASRLACCTKHKSSTGSGPFNGSVSTQTI